MNNNFTIEAESGGEIKVINITLDKDDLPQDVVSSPSDGRLELFIRTEKKTGLFIKSKEVGRSVFSIQSLGIINNKKQPLILDGALAVQTPVEISVLKNGLSMIVGKNRLF